ncbi:transposase [Streptomyces sp. NPDC050416]|uniref:transposase n=1 Tax=Streptomyces sp. NPDC050416 TaxID=3365611 RepID=UPI0037B71331
MWRPRSEFLLEGLPRPARPCTHPARRPDRGGLGQSEHPSGDRAETVRGRARLFTTVRLPPYAPDLNPVEALWSLVRRAMANTPFDAPDDLDRTLRRQLRRIQFRPHLIDGCLTRHRSDPRTTDPTLKTSVTEAAFDTGPRPR